MRDSFVHKIAILFVFFDVTWAQFNFTGCGVSKVAYHFQVNEKVEQSAELIPILYAKATVILYYRTQSDLKIES